MPEPFEKQVELFGDEVQIDESGAITHHPLDDLYYHYQDPTREPVNNNYLTLAGDGLTKTNQFSDVKVFELGFYGEPESDIFREAWADPLRAEILKRLAGAGRSWYITFSADVTELLITHDEQFEPRASKELYEYLTGLGPDKTTLLNSPKPYGYGWGSTKRLFFEVPNDDIKWVVEHVWEDDMGGYPIEGYNFKSGKIALLKEWNERPRDAVLFREVLDETYMMFYTTPAENRHFTFVTNKLSLADFERQIDFGDLKRQAAGL